MRLTVHNFLVATNTKIYKSFAIHTTFAAEFAFSPLQRTAKKGEIGPCIAPTVQIQHAEHTFVMMTFLQELF